jgi:hypothetical protein
MVLAAATAIIVVFGPKLATQIFFKLGDLKRKDSQAQNSSNC